MKRCLECGREYDSSMMFCLDDGAELLYGPASADEPATAILSASRVIAHTALGDKEAAIAMLEKDVEERSSYVVTIGIELALKELHDDPRFKAMLKRMNLPE